MNIKYPIPHSAQQPETESLKPIIIDDPRLLKEIDERDFAFKLRDEPVWVQHIAKALKRNSMKKLMLLIALAITSLASRAQTTAAALADSSFAQKDYVKAADYYEQALKVEPNNIKYLRRTGFCFMNFQGQELNATRFFNAALKIAPNDPVSNYYMGVIFMDQAKQTADKTNKSDFKAKAASYLNKASQYGSDDAKSAIRDLNGI